MKRLAMLVVAMTAIGAPAASAAPTPVTGVRWVLAVDKHFLVPLSNGCISLGEADWHAGGKTKAGEPLYGGSELAAGAWSPATTTGAVTAKGDAVHFEAFPMGKATGRAFKLSKLGLEFAAGKLYLTGQIRRIKALAAAAPPRVRLAVIAHPKLLSGPFHDRGKPPIADSFLFAVQGRATITKALAAAIRRAQCKSRFTRGHRPRAGGPLGQITAQLLPSAATGLGGTVDVFGGLSLIAEDGTDIAVAPGGGATSITIERSPSLRFPLAPGTAAPLSCKYGADCEPVLGATLPMAGQLVLSYGGRSTVVAGLTATYAPYRDVPTVTGTVDGAPVTVSDPNSNSAPDDFLARVSAALGTSVVGELGHLRAHFTSTGPT